MTDDASTAPDYDVAVVGAGPGGTYAAWRLQTGTLGAGAGDLPADPAQRKVVLIEGSGRVGGRLESLTPPGAPTLRAEFGGMGFSPHDTIITKLVDDVFQIPAKPFVLPNDNDLVYVRGEHFTHGQLGDPGTTLPYRLAPDEIGKSAGQLIEQAIDTVIPGSTTWTTEQWREAADTVRVRGRALRDIGYWNVLLLGMSNEAFEFCTDTMGHFFEFDNWNAAQALPWLLSQSVAPYRTLDGGYDLLPKTLFEAFVAAGGTSRLDTSIESIGRREGGGYWMVDTNGFSHSASKVVLAMPRRALEIIAPFSVALNGRDVREMMRSVTGRRVMKIFLTYSTPWWNQLGITSGASTTDLPMSQCWYFDPPAGSGNALLMGSYNDTLKTTYWQGLEGGTPFADSGPTAGEEWAARQASELMVEELQRQLAQLHRVSIPDPYSAAYEDWEKDPFGGAFYTWNVGVDVNSVAQAMLQPDPAEDVYVCGSAYSRDQGWAEGALKTAEQVVGGKLGLASPAW